jgi:hypothetical protein
MKTFNLSGFLFLVVLLPGCIEDSDLQRTIFIRDKQHRDLPQYSEWGYNTFGAYLNDEVFVSGDIYWNPASLSTSDTSMTLSFHGEKRTREKDTTDMILSFEIPRHAPQEGQYLLSLNGEIFDLKNPSTRVLISSETAIFPVTVNSGELHFIRVQNLLVDNNPEETILSGTFEFQGVMDGKPVSVTLGRFDVGVAVGFTHGY